MPLSETDRRLIKDLLSRSDGAWETFIDRYAGLVIQVIRHTSHAHSFKLSADDEDDLCAEVFAGLIDRRMATLRSFRGRSSLATWLTVVVRRIVLRKLKQKRYAEALGHVDVHSNALEKATESHEAAVEDRDSMRLARCFHASATVWASGEHSSERDRPEKITWFAPELRHCLRAVGSIPPTQGAG